MRIYVFSPTKRKKILKQREAQNDSYGVQHFLPLQKVSGDNYAGAVGKNEEAARRLLQPIACFCQN